MTIKHVDTDSSIINCSDKCPVCSYGPLDGCTGMIFSNKDPQSQNINQDKKEIKPKDGDITICVGCASLLIFTLIEGKFKVRLPSEKELFEIDQNFELSVYLKTIQHFFKERNKKRGY